MKKVFFFCLLLLSLSFSSKAPSSFSSFPPLKKGDYLIYYDARFKIPFWVYEKITKESLRKKAARKRCRFEEDPSVYPLHRSTLRDCRKSGYDRGHMAPAADHSSSQQAMQDTFLLTNMCPQEAQLNRGFWSRLEQWSREQVNENDSVEIITGPLFLSEQQGNQKVVSFFVIGENDVAVPTHFYKVVRANRGKQRRTVCFLVPNRGIDPSVPISKFEQTARAILPL